MTELNSKLIYTYTIARKFQKSKPYINGLDFDDQGTLCATTSAGSEIHIYRVSHGDGMTTIPSKKYGCSLVKFTHHPANILIASDLPNSTDHTIRYLRIQDRRFLKYFKGHTAPVNSIDMHPLNDQFVSSSEDKTVRIWDIRLPDSCIGKITLPLSTPVVKYDRTGQLFVVAAKDVVKGAYQNVIKLYSAANFTNGPFVTFFLPSINPNSTGSNKDVVVNSLDQLPNVTDMQFSLDGKQILISTNSSIIYLIDSFTGKCLHIFTDYPNNDKLPFRACFSPDSQFIISSAADRRIYVWNAITKKKIGSLSGSLPSDPPSLFVKWHPKTLMFATASDELCWWLPPRSAISKSQIR